MSLSWSLKVRGCLPKLVARCHCVSFNSIPLRQRFETTCDYQDCTAILYVVTPVHDAGIDRSVIARRWWWRKRKRLRLEFWLEGSTKSRTSSLIQTSRSYSHSRLKNKHVLTRSLPILIRRAVCCVSNTQATDMRWIDSRHVSCSDHKQFIRHCVALRRAHSCACQAPDK